MEEAYNELYQQFLCLRSLCLRQAALLHQLTAALQNQQGAALPNGESSDLMSFAVQFPQEIPAFRLKQPELQTGSAHGAEYPPRNVASFSDLLAAGVSKLSVDEPLQRTDNQELPPKVAPLLGPDSLRWRGASSNGSDHLRGDKMLVVRMPVTDRPSQLSDYHTQSDGRLMSDVGLQSHVCEHCQAVFPGDTTTRGEFLRHLYTHI